MTQESTGIVQVGTAKEEMRMQHVNTAKGQCEAVVSSRKEVKGKRIGVKRNTTSTSGGEP